MRLQKAILRVPTSKVLTVILTGTPSLGRRRVPTASVGPGGSPLRPFSSHGCSMLERGEGEGHFVGMADATLGSIPPSSPGIPRDALRFASRLKVMAHHGWGWGSFFCAFVMVASYTCKGRPGAVARTIVTQAHDCLVPRKSNVEESLASLPGGEPLGLPRSSPHHCSDHRPDQRGRSSGRE